MCGRFQQIIAENGSCNEMRPKFITRRMHDELTSRETKKAVENYDL